MAYSNNKFDWETQFALGELKNWTYLGKLLCISFATNITDLTDLKFGRNLFALLGGRFYEFLQR